ncbi:hypothetical protein BH20ACT22_BH20ACT22_12610 [soil metagenome]
MPRTPVRVSEDVLDGDRIAALHVPVTVRE